MRILLVIDQFETDNNGTTVSARRFARALRERGHEVRVACSRPPGTAPSSGSPIADAAEGRYLFDPLRIPLFDGIIARQGMTLARPDRGTLAEALRWADVAHFLLPFWLCQQGKRLADRIGVPSTGAFHVQPQNITYSFGVGTLRPLNTLIYAAFRPYFNRFAHVHTPSALLADELRARGYRARLHVISNGVDPAFVERRDTKRPAWADRFVIASVGRHSAEKRQDVLIEAVRRSRHAQRIQLVLAGTGPLTARYERMGSELAHPPLIGFFRQDELRGVLAETDLYVHPADAEIEGISCMEAFSSGIVPVIADSPDSATRQFALDARSLFPAGDPAALARTIDWWIEHDDERRRMGHEYARAGRAYSLDASVDAFETMLRQAVVDAGGPAVVTDAG